MTYTPIIVTAIITLIISTGISTVFCFLLLRNVKSKIRDLSESVDYVANLSTSMCDGLSDRIAKTEDELIRLSKQLESHITDDSKDTDAILSPTTKAIYDNPNIITTYVRDVTDLYATLEVPDNQRSRVTKEQIHQCLIKDIANQIGDYVEITQEYDVRNARDEYHARLVVGDKR